MNTEEIDKTLVESYFTLLKNLSPNNKLELISRLSKSLKTKKKAKADSDFSTLFGSWVSDESAEELAAEIKNARNFTRNRVEL